MDICVLEQPGLVEITGEDTFGGEIINPILVSLAVAAGAAVIGSVVNNWSTFTGAVADGWNAATGG